MTATDQLTLVGPLSLSRLATMKHRRTIAVGSGVFGLLAIPVYLWFGNEAAGFALAVIAQLITAVILFFSEPEKPVEYEPVFLLGTQQMESGVGDTRMVTFTLANSEAFEVVTAVEGAEVTTPQHGHLRIGQTWNHRVTQKPALTFPIVFSFTGKLPTGKPFGPKSVTIYR